MANLTVEWKGLDKLEKRLADKNFLNFERVIRKSTTEMRNRAVNSQVAAEGGTPFDTGELREAVRVEFNSSDSSVGYVKDYAPHVEFGHRTRNGGYVEGQNFLNNNLLKQKPLFRDDILEQLKKG